MIASVNGRPIAWRPLPKQAVALACPAFELLYGGEKGGAKTEFLVVCWAPIFQLAHEKYRATGRKQHKCRVVVFRKNLEHLRDFIAKSHDIYPLLDPTASFNINSKTWTFESGATLECKHLDGPEDHRGYHGQELVGVGWDQVEDIGYDQYSFVVANCRSGDADYHRARMVRATANPGGQDWLLKHFFIEECPEGGKIHAVKVRNSDGSEYEITRAFVRARLRDNPFLPPDYEAQLRATMSEDEVAMYLEGDFFRVAGSFFSRLLRPSVHFVESKPIPDNWEMRFGMDWGSTNPASVHVGAVDHDNRLWIIDELHQPGVTGRKFGEAMHEMWARQKWCPTKKWRNDEFYGVIDKQAMDRYGSEQTAAAGIMDWGFRLFEANKDRYAGCNQMKERFLLDRQQQTQVAIFKDRCPQLVRALSAIPSNAPEKPEEYDPRSPWAHACDSFRFLCMEFAVRSVREESPIDVEVARWNRILTAQSRTENAGYAMGTGYGD